MKRFWLLTILLIMLIALGSCAGTRTLMMTAPDAPKSAPAQPPLVIDESKWLTIQSAQIFSQLESNVYGKLPAPLEQPRFSEKRLITDSAFNGSARVEEASLTLSPDGAGPFTFSVVLVTPQESDGPMPVILMQNFCPNDDVIPVSGISPPVNNGFSCDGDSAMSGVFTYFFGRYIASPPVESIMGRGYALAVVHPPDFVPDNAQRALPILDEISNARGDERLGAIGAWAYQAAKIAGALKRDDVYSNVIAYGHSRYGKSALLAASYSGAIEGVIAHQSGTGGASLSRNKPGETVAMITQSYPHWFTPQYATHGTHAQDKPIDQHHLLALIAPRPILLGNARRDVWSDPEGAFRAAKGSRPAYEVYDTLGITAQRLDQFRPADDIAFWIRNGTHGVTPEDWAAFLAFMDAHFK